jgi:hypothetical protein
MSKDSDTGQNNISWYTVVEKIRDMTPQTLRAGSIDIAYSVPQSTFPWKTRGATILLSRKGWQEGATVVFIFSTAFLYIY